MKMKLSVVIPAHNEEGSVESTLTALYRALKEQRIDHEIVVVDDHSTDGTLFLLRRLTRQIPTLKIFANHGRRGFGATVRVGFEHFTGDAVAVYMADASDSPRDLIEFFRALEATPEVDCIFGSRFMAGSNIVKYPVIKLMLNRIANWFVQFLFGMGYNDTTNAFKLYRREVIEGVAPLFSIHFNLTVELPLKAIVRGYRYRIIPNSWTQRKKGISKLKIREMGSRYLFVVLYCLLEKWLSRGDYVRKDRLKAQPKLSSKNKTSGRSSTGR